MMTSKIKQQKNISTQQQTLMEWLSGYQ